MSYNAENEVIIHLSHIPSHQFYAKNQLGLESRIGDYLHKLLIWKKGINFTRFNHFFYRFYVKTCIARRRDYYKST